MEYTEDDFREFAAQLSRPKGALGIEVGLDMNRNNAPMISATIERLRLSGAERILELGHGNGSHIPDLLGRASDLEYTGLEISELMHQEARKIDALPTSRVSFHLYSGELFPFDDLMFDRIMTVNTVYFWKDPRTTLQEMFRVLQTGGSAHITFGQRATMERLPFTKFGFQHYDTPNMKALLNELPWRSIEVDDHADEIPFGPDNSMTREFSIATVVK